jgi:pimeloyl-ACP methyl ester carboxylesterase
MPTGARVAYASIGRGPALVVPAAWIGHQEVSWQDPAIRAFYDPIAAGRTVVTYDKPGCGLSDPWPGRQTLDTDLEALGAVIDQLELDRLDLLGISMGAPVSLAYAVRQPERVAQLILYGGFANGHEVASAEVRTAMTELVRAHWGLGSDMLADIFLPDGTAEMKAHFARLQRESATAELAAELLAQCCEPRGRPSTSRPGSSRSRRWSPKASPTGKSPAAWGSRDARPRGTWSASASGSACGPTRRSPAGGLAARGD